MPGFSLAIGSNGQVYAWGLDTYGQLGGGTDTDSTAPEPIPEQIALPGGVTETAVSAGGGSGDNGFSLAIGSDGHIYAWGYNAQGALGDGTTTGPDCAYFGYVCHDTPEQIGGSAGAVTEGDGHSFALVGQSPPQFTQDSPPTSVNAGSTFDYQFVARGLPAPTYALSGAPAWLSIDPNTGEVSGSVPSDIASFSFAVTATNSQGQATAGPFTVAVTVVPVTVSGTAADSAANPVAGAVFRRVPRRRGACAEATSGVGRGNNRRYRYVRERVTHEPTRRFGHDWTRHHPSR